MSQAIREGRGILWAAAGAVALVGYGAIAALQPDAHFGRVLAAYGAVFIFGSLLDRIGDPPGHLAVGRLDAVVEKGCAVPRARDPRDHQNTKGPQTRAFRGSG
jgi:hypothetical protein